MPTLFRPETETTVWSDPREWWVLNPGPRVDICIDEGITDFVFAQRTYQFKQNMLMSPSKSLDWAARGLSWRAMLVEYDSRVALLYTAENGWQDHAAAWPCWSARDETLDALVKRLERYPEPGDPVEFFTGHLKVKVAKKGQERRIILCNMPMPPLQWERVFRDLMDVKRAFPDIRFHVHGSKTLPRTLGTGIDSWDHPVTTRWIDGQPALLLPSGAELRATNYDGSRRNMTRWGRLLGIRPHQVFAEADRNKKSRLMYRFNLRSLKWAFVHYDKVWSMKVADETGVDPDEPDSSWVPIDIKYKPRAQDATDKWICDICSISDRCPFARPGAICIVEDSEVGDLAKKFKTRRSSDIIDALGTLLGAQTYRAQMGLTAESEFNKKAAQEGLPAGVSTDLTKLIDSIFDRGVVLARLVDPALAAQGKGGARVGIINMGAAGQVGGATKQQLAAGLMAELDKRGLNITDMSPDELDDVFRDMIPQAAIEAEAADSFSSDDDDDDAHFGSGGNAVASGPPAFRATPGVNP